MVLRLLGVFWSSLAWDFGVRDGSVGGGSQGIVDGRVEGVLGWGSSWEVMRKFWKRVFRRKQGYAALTSVPFQVCPIFFPPS